MHVGGDHTFTRLRNLGFSWRWYSGVSKAEEPDRKHVEFEQGVWRTFKDNYRTWSNLDEDSRGAGVDFTLPVGPVTAKAGYLAERKDRTFDAEAYSTDPSSVRQPNYGLLVLPIDSVFAAVNYGSKMFTFVPVTVFTGAYDARQRLGAWYVMGDYAFDVGRLRTRITGGARTEDSRQEVNTVAAIDDPTPFTALVDEKDVLPSAALTLSPVSAVNLRLAHSRSVNRPEFREMANVLYYDLENTQNVIGNPYLQRALIRNYDARLEAFPAEGQVLAVSYFHKDIENAIEEKLIPAPDRYTRTWFNSPNGKNYGWEVEVRQSLGIVHRFVRAFSLAGNYTRVHSAIEYEESQTNELGEHIITTAERVMQGQAPWTANLSLLFSEPAWGTSVNVLFNKVGRRLDAVGDTRDEDVYEEPRTLVDVAVTQHLAKGFETKLAVKNVGAKEIEFTSGPLREEYATVSVGTEYAISFAYKF
jgi:TonB-dependent receptor